MNRPNIFLIIILYLYSSVVQTVSAQSLPTTAPDPTKPNQVVCVNDAGNDGYAGDEGDTAVCQSNSKHDAFFCPIGAVECDKKEKINYLPSVDTCPIGYTKSQDGEACTLTDYKSEKPSANCPAGYSFQSSTNQCIKQSTDTVSATASCPNGFTRNTTNNKCEKGTVTTVEPTQSCPSDQTLKDNRCYATVLSTSCATGAIQQCVNDGEYVVRTQPNNAVTSYTFNWPLGDSDGIFHPHGGGGVAYDSKYVYFAGEYKRQMSNPGLNISYYGICRCGRASTEVDKGEAPKSCPENTAPNSSGKCESGSIETAGEIYSCPTGYTLNTTNNTCSKPVTETSTPTFSCGADFTLNTQKNLCEKTVVTTIAVTRTCKNGFIYNASSKQCEQKELYDSCPIANGGACVTAVSGKPYCSPNPCFNKSEETNVDLIDGKMLTNNGATDSNGMCLDQLYIMSGRKSRCNLTGASTGYKNCCTNDMEVNQDTVGTYSEWTIAMKAINGTYKAVKAAYTAYQAAQAAGATAQAASQTATQTFTQGMASTGVGVVVAVVIMVVMEYFMQACDNLSMETSVLSSSGMCSYVGTYCTKKWLGSCVQKAKSFCCFESKMARIIHEQGRQQLTSFNSQETGIWGTTEKPECRGFTPEEFGNLDWEMIDLTEYYEDLAHEAQENISKDIGGKIKEFYETTRN